MKKITESESAYGNLEHMPLRELLEGINKEDQSVATAVHNVLPAIEKLVKVILVLMQNGGRLFYIGAGTSGRLGIVDASECPPTFGVEAGRVVGIIAGGDGAIRKAVEFAEDDPDQGWKDLQAHHIHTGDAVIGIAASGTTPYVVGAIRHCNNHGILTGAITCNPGSPLGLEASFPVEAIVGPEFVTGSTRMKAGTAQKMILNMVSTSLMIGLGHIQGNKMVDMQPTNNKLVDRGCKMIMDDLHCTEEQAMALLKEHGSVRKAIEAHKRQHL